MTRARHRRATSLIEVVIVIAILGLSSLFAMARWPSKVRKPDDVDAVVAHARAQAIRAFRPVTIWMRVRDTLLAVTAMPDGRIIGMSGSQRLTYHRDIPKRKPVSNAREEASKDE